MNFDEYFLRHVYLAASKSKDPRTKIGAILVRDKAIIATGYNGFPRKVNDSLERYNNKEEKNRFIAHAEANTVYTSARLGICTNESILYTQGIPCHLCAISLINGGITAIYIHKQWPNLCYSSSWVESTRISTEMFKEAEIPVYTYDKFLGLKGYIDGKEILV